MQRDKELIKMFPAFEDYICAFALMKPGERICKWKTLAKDPKVKSDDLIERLIKDDRNDDLFKYFMAAIELIYSMDSHYSFWDIYMNSLKSFIMEFEKMYKGERFNKKLIINHRLATEPLLLYIKKDDRFKNIYDTVVYYEDKIMKGIKC